MGKLVLQLPDGTTRDFPLSRERTTIGRRVDNDICLPYPAVSGEHAAVVTILDDSFLEDLNSTNGTLVNGKSIAKHFLRDGDEIDIGRHTLVYRAGDYSAAEPATPLVDLEKSLGKRVSTAEAPRPSRASESESEQEPRVAARREETLPLPSQDAVSIDTSALFAAPAAVEHAHESANQDEASADAPTLKVLDGPSAGRVVTLGRDDFVIGRVGVQIAVVRKTDEGYRLLQMEGDVAPTVNGVPLPEDGSLLNLGDEVQIAGTRIRYIDGD